jgi:hypothetical protein
MTRKLIALLLPIALLAACGGGDDDPLTEAELAAELSEGDDGLEEEVADCVAANVFEALPEDELDKLTGDALDSSEAPSEEIETALTDAIGTCITAASPDGGDAGGTVEEGAATDFPAEICESYEAWEQTGDTTELFIVQGYVDEVGLTEISEAIDFITSEPPTDTADEQAAFEGAVDYIRGELSVGGCAFS